MRKKKILPREKNEFYVHITMIAKIRLAALLARATLLVEKRNDNLPCDTECVRDLELR